jgi:hypothetical protein
MRTTNYVTMIALIFLGISCSHQDLAENEELASVEYRSRTDQEREPEQEVFELDLHQYYVLGELVALESKKTELQRAIEGGDESLIPILESVQNTINRYMGQLAEIRDLTCLILEQKLKRLKARAEEGDEEAWEEMLDLKEEFETCGLSIGDYFRSATSLFLYATIREKVRGGCQDPGEEWNCKANFKEGRLVVNVLASQGQPDEIQLVSPDGEVMSVAEDIGPHEDFENVHRMSLQLEATERALLQISTGGQTYQRPIEVR